MADIKIDIKLLDSALKKLDTLVSSVDGQRNSAKSNTPIALPSLDDGTLGKTTKWLTEQKPELQTRLDLAKLLDVDGDGQASYKVEHGDKLWEVKQALGNEMTKQLKDLDIDNADDRKRAALLAALLNRYQDDKDVSWQVMNGLGPKGVSDVMNKLKDLFGRNSNGYWQTTLNPGDEHQALIDLQEQMGKGLAGMFSTASAKMDPEWGKKMAEDPWSAAILLHYIDKSRKDVDPAVFESMGTALKDREHNDPTIWGQIYNDPDYRHFGKDSFKEINPLREYLNVADNSTRDAQAVMGNKDLLHYFTVERQDGDHLSTQAGKVLSTATIDAAYSHDQGEAKKAAEISSNLLFDIGGKEKPLDGVKEEVGGIIATYIGDADRVHDANVGEDTPGTHAWGDKDNPYGFGLGKESGLPAYGINLNQAVLRGALQDVGDNEAAASAVGRATSILNAARFDYAAEHQRSDSGSMHKAAHEGATLTGFMTDSLVNGDIESATEAAKERKKIAELFTSPIDLVKTDKVPVIGDLVKGAVKDAIVDGYTADKTSDAIKSANENQTSTMSLTQLQALYAMEKHDLPSGVDDWPTEHGRPKLPEELSKEEMQRVLLQADGQTGLTSDVTGEIDNSFDDFQKKYGDK
ncbi:hypothetical protein E0H73_07940 [Kribbella pittospori]|uniref:Uncharacterized protein n=1 Tax=Kribbella pittospori TaxID=722689 RepID=A0A4R0KTQ8_9ACTN|nr:hypothetical protein [Kribbella pittospori]TCC64331.1 hypothetical protein E0H73_07940 [Kribbella pittospori]